MNEECKQVGHSLRNLKEVMIDHWEREVRKTLVHSKMEESPVLRNHISEILDNLSHLLIDGELDDIEMGKAHGFQRAVLTKFTVQEIMMEFALLRSTIIDFLYPFGDRDCAKLVHNYIDIITKYSVAEFLYDLTLLQRVKREEPGNEIHELRSSPYIVNQNNQITI